MSLHYPAPNPKEKLRGPLALLCALYISLRERISSLVETLVGERVSHLTLESTQGFLDSQRRKSDGGVLVPALLHHLDKQKSK